MSPLQRREKPILYLLQHLDHNIREFRFRNSNKKIHNNYILDNQQITLDLPIATLVLLRTATRVFASSGRSADCTLSCWLCTRLPNLWSTSLIISRLSSWICTWSLGWSEALISGPYGGQYVTRKCCQKLRDGHFTTLLLLVRCRWVRWWVCCISSEIQALQEASCAAHWSPSSNLK